MVIVMELSQSSPTHMQRLQRSPLHPGLSHHAKQILGPAFGSRLLRLSIWHNFLIFSPHNEPGNEPRAVCDPMHTQGLMRLCMAYLPPTTTSLYSVILPTP